MGFKNKARYKTGRVVLVNFHFQLGILGVGGGAVATSRFLGRAYRQVVLV